VSQHPLRSSFGRLAIQGEAFSGERGDHRQPDGAFEVNRILKLASVGFIVPVLFGCSPAAGAATTDGPLILGSLLAATGPVAFYALPEFAGMAAAVDAVNSAGGVLGKYPVGRLGVPAALC
jgi:ABC-type branched-subunit amino acid transport system substrate-binding protein